MPSGVRRLLRPQNLVSLAIIAAVAAMVAYANWRDVQRARLTQGFARPWRGMSVPRGQGANGVQGLPAVQGTSREDLERRVQEMEARLAKNADDTGAALMLADALIRQTRVTGNPGLTIRAEAALNGVLRDDRAEYEANRMLGMLYLSQHRFRDAARVGEKNRDARPYDPVSYGIVGDAMVELGEYDAAFAAFDQMMRLRPNAASYARVAYARELQGNLTGSVEAMKLAIDATSPTDAEGLAWTRSQLGDLYFQLRNLREARQAYAAASQAFPGHPFAVIGYARVLAEQGDVGGALDLLRGLATRAPTPDLAARIGDLLERQGQHDAAERQWALAEAGWRGDAPEPKNLARFLAEHNRKIGDAVAIAEAAARERHDIFTEDALACAYFKAGRIGDARSAIAQALRTGTRDAAIRAHAQAIDAAEPRAQLAMSFK